jgi:high-affinity Fe2+/Pb2+ permease
MARIHVYVFLVCYVIYIIYNYIYILYERTTYHIFANYIYIEYISISHIESSIISCETGKNFSISPLYLIDSHYISMI